MTDCTRCKKQAEDFDGCDGLCFDCWDAVQAKKPESKWARYDRLVMNGLDSDDALLEAGIDF